MQQSFSLHPGEAEQNGVGGSIRRRMFCPATANRHVRSGFVLSRNNLVINKKITDLIQYQVGDSSNRLKKCEALFNASHFVISTLVHCDLLNFIVILVQINNDC